MMQDILTNKKESKDVGRSIDDSSKEAPKEASGRRADTNTISEVVSQKKEEKTGHAPAFPSIETSPIFEKMKQHNKEREVFSDGFGVDTKKSDRGFFRKIALISGVILVLGAFLYGIFFYDAVLAITLKHADVSLQNQEFLAGGAGADTLAFQLMTLSDEASADLVATGEKNITSKSSGKIIIYNNFSAQTQPLIKNTRFETSDGKIYRIHDSVVIPGQKVVGGKKIPGSLEADVFADTAGSEYNIGPVDFTIPGFKKSPKYDKFYARSKTPMTGGASGLVKIVSPDDIQKAKDKLVAGLKEKLLAQSIAQKPKGTILYKDGVFYNFTDSMDTGATAKGADDKVNDKTVKLVVKGSLTATLFNTEDLSKRIVKASVSTIDVSANDRILVTNIEDLTFALKNPGDTAPKETDTYAFTLNGSAKAVWQVDTVALAGKLAGVKKSDYKNVFTEFPGIEKANARIRPFWKTKFPSDTAKVRVEVTPN